MPEFVVRKLSFHPRPLPGEPPTDYPPALEGGFDTPQRPPWGTIWAEPAHRDDDGLRHRVMLGRTVEQIRRFSEPGDIFQLTDDSGR